MAGGALYGVGVSTGSFRAPVAESSNLRLRLFCCHFLAEGGKITLEGAPGGLLSKRAAVSALLGA